MMERGKFSSPDTTISVCSLVVTSVVQALSDGTPLHRKVIIVVERCHLVYTPRERAMVDDDARLLSLPDSISPFVHIFFLPTTDTDKTDDIVTPSLDGIISQRDTRRRSRLPCDGCIVANVQVFRQGNHTPHVKHHDFLCRPTHSPAQRAFGSSLAIISQRGHVSHLTATSSRDKSAVSLCSRKGRNIISHRRNST